MDWKWSSVRWYEGGRSVGVRIGGGLDGDRPTVDSRADAPRYMEYHESRPPRVKRSTLVLTQSGSRRYRQPDPPRQWHTEECNIMTVRQYHPTPIVELLQKDEPVFRRIVSYLSRSEKRRHWQSQWHTKTYKIIVVRQCHPAGASATQGKRFQFKFVSATRPAT